MENKKPTYPWNTREVSYKKTLTYLTDRMLGKVTSLITPWPRLNTMGVNGWEWGSAVAFCSRPGGGKTVLIDELVRKVYGLNPNTKMRILKFELEMLSQVTAIREFSAVLGKSYTYLCSAEEEVLMNEAGMATGFKKKFTKSELMKCWEYVQRKTEKEKDSDDLKFPEDLIETSPTVEEFEAIIHKYMEAYKKVTKGKDKEGNEIDIVEYTNTLVTIDHLRLIRKKENQAEQVMLYEACLTINRLKKQFGYPIIFVALNHLVRDVNNDTRTEDGKHSNYLRDSDIFGADAIMQNFDIVVIMDRPAARNIRRYGPSNYIIDDEYMLIITSCKVRNGIPGMSFFRGEFDKMQIVEIDTPAKAASKAAEDRKDYKNSNQQTKANL